MLAPKVHSLFGPPFYTWLKLQGPTTQTPKSSSQIHYLTTQVNMSNLNLPTHPSIDPAFLSLKTPAETPAPCLYPIPTSEFQPHTWIPIPLSNPTNEFPSPVINLCAKSLMSRCVLYWHWEAPYSPYRKHNHAVTFVLDLPQFLLF